MSHFWEDDIIGTRVVRSQTAGLDLFERPRTVSTAAMPGAGQVSRDEARERATRGSADAYRRILDALASGGMTRKELAEATGLPSGTINARVSEMRARTDDLRVITEGRRNGESVCHLATPHREGRVA